MNVVAIEDEFSHCDYFVAISAIPKIVCETIHALELHDETPSWKIMDNKGRVTVVLHWDQRSSSSSQVQQQQKGSDSQSSKYSPTKKADLGSSQRPSLVIQTSLDKLNYGNYRAAITTHPPFSKRHSWLCQNGGQNGAQKV